MASQRIIRYGFVLEALWLVFIALAVCQIAIRAVSLEPWFKLALAGVALLTVIGLVRAFTLSDESPRLRSVMQAILPIKLLISVPGLFALWRLLTLSRNEVQHWLNDPVGLIVLLVVTAPLVIFVIGLSAIVLAQMQSMS